MDAASIFGTRTYSLWRNLALPTRAFIAHDVAMGRPLAFVPLLFLILGCSSPAKQRDSLRQSALDLLLQIDAAYCMDDGLYAGELQNDKPTAAAHAWPASVQLSALAAAAQVDPFWRNRLERYVVAMDAYWNTAAPIAGYDASARPRQLDRYYDDNAWLVLALLEAHWVTRDADHLRRADNAMKFVLSGEDDRLGGGIWWHEQTRKSKHSCSTAPTIVALLRLYQTTGKSDYYAAALRLYRWINSTLQDRDGLYFDHIKLDESIDRTKFSYNSGVMILANCEFFDITQEPKYLDEARRIAKAAVKFWIDPANGGVRDDAAFASLLLESLFQLYRRDGDQRWFHIASDCLRFVRDKNADKQGWHPTKWDEQPRTLLKSPKLIDQAATVRAFLQAEIVR